MPKFSLQKDDGRFIIVDEEGTRYGAYETEEAAEIAIEDWTAYYAAPLVF